MMKKLQSVPTNSYEMDNMNGDAREHSPFIINTNSETPKIVPEEQQISPTCTDHDTTKALCNHIQSLIYNHLSNEYTTSCAKQYTEIDQHITQLKNILLKFNSAQQNKSNHDISNNKDIQNNFYNTPTQTTRISSYDLKNQNSLRKDPLYSINSVKHCNCEGSLRQDWNTVELEDEERNWQELKPCWFELFFDLMFVASIVHISNETVYLYDHGHGSISFILQVFAQFGLFALCWIEHVLYTSRFRMNQPIDAILRFIYMALVLAMGLGISDEQSFHKSFLISYMFVKFTMCIMLIKASFIPRAFNHSLFMISEKIISIIVTIFILVFINMNSSLVYLIIFVSLFIYSYLHIIIAVYCDCIRRLGINIPINVPHIAERMGAFVLIILGETIISIVVQHFDISDTHSMIRAYILTFAFFLIVYMVGKLYFESQPTEHEIYEQAQAHALSSVTSIWSSRIYCLVHFILFFGLLGIGMGAKLVTHNANHDTQSIEIVFVPGISCIVTLIAINIIKLTHPFDYSKFNKILVIIIWIIRLITIVFMFAILFAYDKMNKYYNIPIIYVICFIIQIIIDFESRDRMKENTDTVRSTSSVLKHQTSGHL